MTQTQDPVAIPTVDPKPLMREAVHHARIAFAKVSEAINLTLAAGGSDNENRQLGFAWHSLCNAVERLNQELRD